MNPSFAANFKVASNWDFVLKTRLACRLPHCPEWYEELDFVFDTGAEIMNVYWQDLTIIMGHYDPNQVGYPPIIGVIYINNVSGTVLRYVVELEICHIDPVQNLRMTPWVRVQTTVTPGSYTPQSTSRLDAGVLRHLLYMGFAPDGNDNLYLAMNKTNMTSILPTFDVSNVQDPPQIPLIPPNPPQFLIISGPPIPSGPKAPKAPKAPVHPHKGVRLN